MFVVIRKISTYLLIASVIIFTLFAILGIWEVIEKEAFTKSLSSIFVVILSTLIILLISLERDKKWIFGKAGGEKIKHISVGRIILIVIGILFGLWLIPMLFSLLFFAF